MALHSRLVKGLYHLRRQQVFAACAALALVGCGRSPAPASVGSGVVNFYNWTDYIAPDVLVDFEKETGIKVRLATFPSQEVLETTLLAGQTQFDVVTVAANVLERLSHANVFVALDRTRLPHWDNLDADLMAQLARQDAGNRFAVVYMWGTTGIGVNVSKVAPLVPDMQIDSWRLIFDPAVVSKLAGCGIAVIDAPSEVIATVLMYLGKDPHTTVGADFDEAERTLMSIRPFVRKIDSDSQTGDFAAGDICLMLTWSTNVMMARKRNADAAGHADLRYVIPREGTVSWMDTLAIPAGAPHAREAHALIDYLLRADIAARNATFVSTASGNRAGRALMPPALREDPVLYPTLETQQRLQPIRARADAENRVTTRIWTRFRTGR